MIVNESVGTLTDCEREDMVDNMISDAIAHYSRNTVTTTRTMIVDWLNEIARERHFRSATDPWATHYVLGLLSALQAGGSDMRSDNAAGGWVKPFIVVHTIQNISKYEYVCKTRATEKMGFASCPTYLSTEEEREYERLTCGAISNYELCVNGASIVKWLRAFKASLYDRQADPRHCKALSLMYHCGTFVSAHQAMNIVEVINERK